MASGGDPRASMPGRVWPDRALTVLSPPALIDHFVAEYGEGQALTVPGAPEPTSIGPQVIVRALDARRGPSGATGAERRIRRERHKTTRWRTRLGSPDHESIDCEVETIGVFGRSLLQSVVVEPLIAIALARRDLALLSAAGIVLDGRAIAICGMSRTGKSTLALRAWAAGRRVLADDRLVVTSAGQVAGFTRRSRIYPDLVATAPLAAERIGRRLRTRLTVAGLVRRVSGGFVGLPVLADRHLLQPIQNDPVPLGAIFVIDRTDPNVREDAVGDLDDPAAVRARLEAIATRDLAWVAANGDDWRAASAATVRAQLDVIDAALAASGAATRVLAVPGSWDAVRAVRTVADLLETG